MQLPYPPDRQQVKLAEMERFMQKQKLPRLVNTAPELDAAEIAFDRGAKPLGRGGFGIVLRATLVSSQESVAVKKLFSVTSGKPPSPRHP